MFLIIKNGDRPSVRAMYEKKAEGIEVFLNLLHGKIPYADSPHTPEELKECAMILKRSAYVYGGEYSLQAF